jgi:valyl-tRNA synthetase
MSAQELLDPVYDPRAVEPAVYAAWEAAEAFRSVPADTPRERTFTIVIPPPNVTGALHLGHALNNTIQDILIRWHRMRGFNTLWQPGTDHAGIATQAVVERRIRQVEGKSRHDIGREELVRRIWEWKDEYEQRIVSQLKLMGCSCDWSRNRFTLDEGLARAVRRQFFNLFRDGLIFRGKRLVNWDTELQTAVSNDEVYYETVKGHFWHFRYPVIDPRPGEPEFVVIATTRPETMLGDVAVAVNPDPAGELRRREEELRAAQKSAPAKERPELQRRLDAIAERRTTHLPRLIQLRDMARAGRKVKLPLVCREIPLIRDDWADPTLGTGCVKITPAHDANDYEVGARHRLPLINVLTADGKIAEIIEPDGTRNPRGEAYAGLPFSTDGRAKVVTDMESRGLIEAVEDHEVERGHSDRSKTPIEPFLSDQWFLKTTDIGERLVSTTHGQRFEAGVELGDGSRAAGLAQAAIDVVANGRIQVFPGRYAKSYLDWLGEKRDWCISRQLWWGHRIPVWQWEHMPGTFAPGDVSMASVLHDLKTEYCQAPWSRLVDDANAMAGSEHYLCLGGSPDTEEIEALRCAGARQEEDVLDTWFSSALWPFSTLGWPEDTPHLRQYYPTSVLCTSRDIITNWVARMVMFGLYSMGEVPFDHVYIHPKILDGRGETMSKSKGNGVDPVDVIHTHGADALRYTMADMTTETQDIRMPVEYVCPHCGKATDQGAVLKVEEQSRKSRGEKLERRLHPADVHRARCGHSECGREFATQWADATLKDGLGAARETSDKFDLGRNFCNKLWNAARYALMNLADTRCDPIEPGRLLPEDRWILARLSETARAYHACVAHYQFSGSVKVLREFFWDSLCDWYIELTKPRLTSDGGSASGRTARQVLAFCLDQVLRLWHPTIPFITEHLWGLLNAVVPRRGLPGVAGVGELPAAPLLTRALFPPGEGYPALDDAETLKVFHEIQDVVRGVRDLRLSCKVSPKEAVRVTVALPQADRAAFESLQHIVLAMAKVRELTVDPHAVRPRNAASVAIRALHVYVHDISDDEAERNRTKKALEDLDRQIKGKEAKLANEKFVAHADPEVVAAERERLAEYLAQQRSLREHLAELGV